MKDLNLLKRYIEYQETSYNFRLGFPLLNRPHLHRAYVVNVCNQIWLAVCIANCFRYILIDSVFHIPFNKTKKSTFEKHAFSSFCVDLKEENFASLDPQLDPQVSRLVE